MDDWGTDGPVFGPYLFAHTTYGWDIKMGKPAQDCSIWDYTFTMGWVVDAIDKPDRGKLCQIKHIYFTILIEVCFEFVITFPTPVTSPGLVALAGILSDT